MPFDIVGSVFAAIVAGGGVMGYVKSSSTPSLIAGLAFGGLLAYGAYEASKHPANYIPQLAASTVLGSMMSYKYIKTGKIMPSGLIAALSIAMVCRCGYQMMIARK